MQPIEISLPTEQSTLLLGQKLASIILHLSSFTLHLHGDLGAGKTTFSRGFLQQLGHHGHVKSPTYTLVEQYHLPPFDVFHFDLYRLSDPEELEYLGIRDYFGSNTIRLIEWPEKAVGFLSQPDIKLELFYQDKGRIAKFTAYSVEMSQLLKQL